MRSSDALLLVVAGLWGGGPAAADEAAAPVALEAPAPPDASVPGELPDAGAPKLPVAPPPPASAAAADAGVAAGSLAVALLSFESNKAATDMAPAVSALVASHLAGAKQLKVITDRDMAAALGLERQRRLLGGGGCSESSCLTEVSAALGARFLVSGRLDRVGSSYMLTASLYDSQKAASIAKPRADAASDDGLRRAAVQVATELLEVLGAPEKPGPSTAALAGANRLGLSLGLKLGNQFLESIAALNPGAELEVGWAFDPEWLAFLQIGFNFVRGGEGDKAAKLTVVPTVLGVRKLYFVPDSFQPYWGLGMGLQLSIGEYGPIESTDSFPTVIGMFGFEYELLEDLNALAEASINIAQLVLGLRSKQVAGNGLNFDLSLGLIYRF